MDVMHIESESMTWSENRWTNAKYRNSSVYELLVSKRLFPSLFFFLIESYMVQKMSTPTHGWWVETLFFICRACLNTNSGVSHHFTRGDREMGNFFSNKSPGDADAAGWGPHCKSHCLVNSRPWQLLGYKFEWRDFCSHFIFTFFEG